MGPIVVDVAGYELTQEDREILEHPLIGGLILFTRNYAEPGQLQALVKDIRRAAKQPIIISVDHEGGRVQRFREQFSRIPAMGKIAEFYFEQNAVNNADDIEKAKQFTRQCGWLLAAELLAFDIDLSFAPVLDLERGSSVIGDRSFHRDPRWVSELSAQLCIGMHESGMKTTGKHFPGHGSIEADSHIALPVDDREFSLIDAADLQPFRALIAQGHLDAIMPAHVVYSQVDEAPAGFSRHWLQQILRSQLGFNGVIFSDDLSMQGASVAGDYLSRAQQALRAGCDLLLACNDRSGVISLLDGLEMEGSMPRSADLLSLKHRTNYNLKELQSSSRWQEYASAVAQFNSQFKG